MKQTRPQEKLGEDLNKICAVHVRLLVGLEMFKEHFLYFSIDNGNVIIPTVTELIFFRGVETTNQLWNGPSLVKCYSWSMVSEGTPPAKSQCLTVILAHWVGLSDSAK